MHLTRGVGSSGLVCQKHQIRELLDSVTHHRGWGSMEVHVPLMKMKCAQNSSDSVGELGRVIVDQRKQHKYM